MPFQPIANDDTIYTLNPSEYLVGREMPPDWSAAPVVAAVGRDEVLNPQTNKKELKTIIVWDESVRDAKGRPYKPLIAGAGVMKSIARFYGEFPSKWIGKAVPLFRTVEKDKRTHEPISVIRVSDTLPGVNICPPSERAPAPSQPSAPRPAAPAAASDPLTVINQIVTRHAQVFERRAPNDAAVERLRQECAMAISKTDASSDDELRHYVVALVFGKKGLKELNAAQLAGLRDTISRPEIKQWVNAKLDEHMRAQDAREAQPDLPAPELAAYADALGVDPSELAAQEVDLPPSEPSPAPAPKPVPALPPDANLLPRGVQVPSLRQAAAAQDPLAFAGNTLPMSKTQKSKISSYFAEQFDGDADALEKAMAQIFLDECSVSVESARYANAEQVMRKLGIQ